MEKIKKRKGQMKKFSIIAAFFIGLFLPSASLLGVTSIASINANNFVQIISNTSQYVRIEGKIRNSEITDNSKVIFLNFGNNFNTSLSAVIYNMDIPAFIDAGINEPEKYFKNKKVVVEGIIRICNGKPEIIVNSPDQIKIIEQ